jgi:hypothetical protein
VAEARRIVRYHRRALSAAADMTVRTRRRAVAAQARPPDLIAIGTAVYVTLGPPSEGRRICPPAE